MNCVKDRGTSTALSAGVVEAPYNEIGRATAESLTLCNAIKKAPIQGALYYIICINYAIVLKIVLNVSLGRIAFAVISSFGL